METKAIASITRLLAWRPGGLARDSTELLVWLVLRALLQAFGILLLARSLGPESYGKLVALLAIAGIFASVSGLGLSGVLLRDGSRTPGELPRLLGMALRTSARATFGFTFLAMLAVALALPDIGAPITLVAFVVFAEIASTTIVELVGRAFQAKHRIRAFGALQAGLPCVRLIAICLFLATSEYALETWLWTYAGVNAAYVLATFVLARARIGWEFGTEKLWPFVRQGIPFTVGAASARVQGEYNKPLLAQAAFSQAAQFNVAQRVIDLVNLPILAVQEALWPRLYAAPDHVRRLLFAGAALTLMSLAGIGLVTVASFATTRVLGDEYASAAELMLWLAGLPLLSVLRNLGGFHLIATGRTHLLTWVYVAGAIASIGFATYWIPEHGMQGAVWSSYATEAVALILLTGFAFRPNRPMSLPKFVRKSR